jgi:hypothetical protein
MEPILLPLLQLKNNVAGKKFANPKGLATGKALLTQIRTLCVYSSLFEGSIQGTMQVCLLVLLKFLSTLDNDTDRKTLRCLLYLLSDTISKAMILSNKCDVYDDFSKFLQSDMSNQSISVARKSVIIRNYGIILSSTSNHSTNITDMLLSLVPPPPTKSKKESTILIAISVFSAIRRISGVLPREFAPNISVILLSNRAAPLYCFTALSGHIFAILLNTVKTCKNASDLLFWSEFYEQLLKNSDLTTLLFKDSLITTYIIRACSILIVKTLKNDMLPTEVMNLLQKTLQIVTTARYLQLEVKLVFYMCFI